MVTVRETAGARLLEHGGIQFWIQKRWQRADGSLTPAGKQAMAIAADCRRRHAGFDAAKTFTVAGGTERAVLLSCEVDLPHEGRRAEAKFWVPRSMAADYRFVMRKVREVEDSFPFAGAKVIWPGLRQGI